MKYKHEDGTPFTKEEFLQKLKTDKEFNDKFGSKGIDQISELIKQLKDNPNSRRLLVSAWAVHDLPNMVLPPCHYGFQVYIRELSREERIQIYVNQYMGGVGKPAGFEDAKLTTRDIPTRAISLMWNQRSVDVPLGLPFNIASYGLLLEIIARMVNMVPDELIGNLGDCHIYENQIDGIKEQMGRELSWEERKDLLTKEQFRDEFGHLSPFVDPIINHYLDSRNIPTRTREPYPLPTLNINTEFWATVSGESGVGPLVDNVEWLIRGMEITDFQVENYQSHPSIKIPLSN